MSLVLGPGGTSYYQSSIRVMRWMINIKYIDVNTKFFPIIMFSNAKTEAFEGSIAYHVLPEAHALFQISV